jgi:hypothetical protein
MRLASVKSTAVGPARSIFENGRKTMKMMRSECSSLKFSQIVADAVSPHLTSLGFRPKSLLDPQRHQVVSFARERGGRHEEIWIGRKLYDAGDPAVRDADERDDTEPVGGNPRVLASRRLFYASVVADGMIADVLPSGNVGLAEPGERYWPFADEADLRRQLERLIPIVAADTLAACADAPSEEIGARGN